MPIIPPEDRAVHLTSDGQGHLAVTLSRCRRFELSHALLKIRAAVTAKVGSSG